MAGMYNTNLLEQGQVIMLDFGKNYNKSSGNQAVNPVSLNRYWLVISETEEIENNGSITVLPIRSLENKNPNGINAVWFKYNGNTEQIEKDSIYIPKDAQLNLPQDFPDGAFVAKSHNSGVIYSSFGMAEEIMCDLPRSFLVREILNKFLIRNKVSNYVLYAAVSTMLYLNRVNFEMLSKFCVSGMINSERKFTNYRTNKTVPMAISMMRDREVEDCIEHEDETVQEEKPDTVSVDVSDDSSEEKTVLNIVSHGKTVRTIDLTKDTTTEDDIPDIDQESKDILDAKEDELLILKSVSEIFNDIYESLKLDMVQKVSLETMLKHYRKATEHHERYPHSIFNIESIDEFKQRCNFNPKWIISKNKNKELVNAATAKKILENIKNNILAYFGEDHELDILKDILLKLPKDWNLDDINIYYKALVKYHSNKNMLDAVGITDNEVYKDVSALSSRNGLIKIIKNIEKSIVIKDNLMIQKVNGGSLNNFRSSTLQYIIIALKELRKDIQKYPAILDMNPDSVTDDEGVLFMVSKYCAAPRGKNREIKIHDHLNNDKRSLFSTIRNLMDEEFDRIIYDIRLFLLNK